MFTFENGAHTLTINFRHVVFASLYDPVKAGAKYRGDVDQHPYFKVKMSDGTEFRISNFQTIQRLQSALKVAAHGERII